MEGTTEKCSNNWRENFNQQKYGSTKTNDIKTLQAHIEENGLDNNPLKGHIEDKKDRGKRNVTNLCKRIAE